MCFSSTLNGVTTNRPQSPARETDIAQCEKMLGYDLPLWLRQRLLHTNRWETDDTAGRTERVWDFLPVLDRSSRKTQIRTAENIVYHTRKLSEITAIPKGAVVVALSGLAHRLLLLPIKDCSRLGDELHVQIGNRAPDPEPIDPAEFFASPNDSECETRCPVEQLPVFRYHLDPVATGAFVRNNYYPCLCCGKKTGWKLHATPYGRKRVKNICPWCIADGSAAAKFGVSFVSTTETPLPAEVEEELYERTPKILSWQDLSWKTCCNDAAVYVGVKAWEELADLPGVKEQFLAEGLTEDALAWFDPNSDFWAHLFHCRHCEKYLVHSDFS